MADRVVAAHCHGKPGIMAALAAGVRTIEHGTYLDEEAAAAMRETGAILVTDPHHRPGASWTARRRRRTRMAKLEALADRHAAGGGAGPRGRGDRGDGHRHRDVRRGPAGLVGSQRPRAAAARRVRATRPLEAIEAATANGPATLGPQAPRSGQLRPGYDADLLMLDARSAGRHRRCWPSPDKITGVWKAGSRVKG